MKRSHLGFGVILVAALLAVLLLAGTAYAGTYNYSGTTTGQHQLTLFAGTTVQAQENDAGLCAVLSVTGPSGFYRVDNNGGSCVATASLNFTAPTTGLYTFEAADGNGRSASYTLDITTTVPDTDSDGYLDDVDNCPYIANADQANNDGDSQGDVCDPDDDNDGVDDGTDNCPLLVNADQANADADALGDACDPDDDNDGFNDGVDNCPLVANPDQADLDGNGTGDACDGDTDGDGVLNGADNCPLVANASQLDSDSDGLGDVCDPTPLVPEPPIIPWIGWDPGDGRLNPDAAAPAAIYLDGDLLHVYPIGADGAGWEALSVPLGEIGEKCAPPPPAVHTLIASAEGGRVRLYCLNTGEVQLNVFGGPVEVVYVWDVLPGWSYQITYAFDTATFERLSLHVDFPK